MRTRRFIGFGLLWIGLALSMLSSAQAFERLATRTGLKAVYHLNIPDRDTVQLHLVFHTGESDLSGPEGLAHYVEHLVAMHIRGRASETLTVHRSNASTNSRLTTYWQEGPAAERDELFTKLARAFERPDLPRDVMLRERAVVAREYDLRVSENPEFRFYTRLGKVLYAGKPIGRSVIGTPQSIGSLTIEDAFAHYRRTHVPANATLVIAGDITRGDAVRLVEKQFGSIAGGKAPGRGWMTDIPGGTERIDIRHADSQVEAGSVFHRKIVRFPGHGRIQLAQIAGQLKQILTSSLPGSLAGPLRYDAAIVSQFRLELSVLTSDVLEISFWAKPETGNSFERVVETYEGALRRLAATGLPEASVRRSVSRTVKRVRRLSDRPGARMAAASIWLAHDTPPPSARQALAGIEAVSKADLDRLLQAMVRPGRSVVGFITPE